VGVSVAAGVRSSVMVRKSEFDNPGTSWPALEVRIVPYDERWPQLFALERELIRGAVGELLHAIHHFGSTSVPGLSAKPIIDIVATYRMPPSEVHRERLGAIGYVHARNVDDTDIVFLGKGNHEYHLLLVPIEHGTLVNKLAVRDYLRVHPDESAAYGGHKTELAAMSSGIAKDYALGKREFVDALEARALEWARNRK